MPAAEITSTLNAPSDTISSARNSSAFSGFVRNFSTCGRAQRGAEGSGGVRTSLAFMSLAWPGFQLALISRIRSLHSDATKSFSSPHLRERVLARYGRSGRTSR